MMEGTFLAPAHFFVFKNHPWKSIIHNGDLVFLSGA